MAVCRNGSVSETLPQEYLHVDLGGVNDVTALVPNAAFGAALTAGFNGGPLVARY
jgi:hypothetical protein